MISIIVPTLNEEKGIEKMLTGLKKLTDFQYEIIVSDGHSTDNTQTIAKQYADKVVAHDGKTRQNIAQGRNAGAEVATGEYVVFLDADVTILDMNDFFKKALACFEKDPKLVGITANVRVMSEFETLSDSLNSGFINTVHGFSNNILRIGMAMGEFQMVRREVFNSVGGFNEKIVAGEDQEFFRRLSRSGRTLLPNNLTVYHTGRRIHKVGWPRIWTTWMIDGTSVLFFKRSRSKEWKVMR